MNYFEMFLDTWKQPTGRWCQIRSVGRMWSKFKSTVRYRRWCGSVSVWSAVTQTCNNLIDTRQTDVWFSATAVWEILRLFFPLSPVEVRRLYACLNRELTDLQDWDWSFGSKFPPLSPDFLTQPCTVLTLTEPSTGTAIEFRWKFYFLAPGRK